MSSLFEIFITNLLSSNKIDDDDVIMYRKLIDDRLINHKFLLKEAKTTFIKGDYQNNIAQYKKIGNDYCTVSYAHKYIELLKSIKKYNAILYVAAMQIHRSPSNLLQKIFQQIDVIVRIAFSKDIYMNNTTKKKVKMARKFLKERPTRNSIYLRHISGEYIHIYNIHDDNFLLTKKIEDNI